MRTRALAAAVAAAAGLTLAGCGGSDDTNGASAQPAGAPATAPPTARASELSPEVMASIREKAGLPPTPDPATIRAYILDLNTIDPDIVHGKQDKAVSRGINQCSSIKSYPNDRDKLISLTNSRFTSPNHPEGHGLAKAARILDVVHKHICPSY